jgi:hypothetical protein
MLEVEEKVTYDGMDGAVISVKFNAFVHDMYEVFFGAKSTVLEHSRLPLEKTIAVMEHLREGCGIRGTVGWRGFTQIP